MPIDTSNDRPGMLRQRNPEAAFTEGFEQGNVASMQGILEGLIARRPAMAKQTEQQLGELFASAPQSYGRVRAVGMTAADASKMVDRAFAKGK